MKIEPMETKPRLKIRTVRLLFRFAPQELCMAINNPQRDRQPRTECSLFLLHGHAASYRLT